jgi:Fe-S-cluster containining protein
MNVIGKEGFNYLFNAEFCKRCEGRCCNGETGSIFVNRDEIETISRFLKMEAATFIAEYLRKESYRFSLKEVKENKNYACVLFDSKRNRCSIYPVRPTQCKTFPFWDYFKDKPEELARECPGVLF